MHERCFRSNTLKSQLLGDLTTSGCNAIVSRRPELVLAKRIVTERTYIWCVLERSVNRLSGNNPHIANEFVEWFPFYPASTKILYITSLLKIENFPIAHRLNPELSIHH